MPYKPSHHGAMTVACPRLSPRGKRYSSVAYICEEDGDDEVGSRKDLFGLPAFLERDPLRDAFEEPSKLDCGTCGISSHN